MLIQNISRNDILFTTDNIRPVSSIGDERVHVLAANIKENAGPEGVLGSGLEGLLPGSTWISTANTRSWTARRRRGARHSGRHDPLEIVPAPADIWASDPSPDYPPRYRPVRYFRPGRAGLRLHHTPTTHGTETTWADVCAVMGNDKKYWSHHQHILKLVPDLRADVLAGRIRNDAAAYIGRDLSADLQVSSTGIPAGELQEAGQLRQIIDQINDLSTVVVVDTEDEPDEDFSFDNP